MKRGTLQKLLTSCDFLFTSSGRGVPFLTDFNSVYNRSVIQFNICKKIFFVYLCVYKNPYFYMFHIFTPMFRFLLLFIHVSFKYLFILNPSVLSSILCSVLDISCLFIPHDKLISSLPYETVTSTLKPHLHPHKHSNRVSTQNLSHAAIKSYNRAYRSKIENERGRRMNKVTGVM